MTLPFSARTIVKIALIAAVLVILRCVWLWQPERQVRLHQEHLLVAAQEGNLSKLGGFMDDGFRTPTGHDKTWALQQAGMVLRQFISLKIVASDTTVAVDGDTARVRSVIRLDGNGAELAEMAKTAVNGSNDPFEFTWKHASWKPWDWRLTGVDHPLIRRDIDLE
ncbi:MAG TPA: hypothetical protein VG733_19200 [Chthoniobacteraceae bacterium]|nr:hypothetical protein [Chthoniobacteraceae bacterium]